jgi:hypothetical protein
VGHRGPNTANNARSARAFAQVVELAPVIALLEGRGVTTLNGIATEPHARGIPTPQGGQRWHAAQVDRVLKRLAALPQLPASGLDAAPPADSAYRSRDDSVLSAHATDDVAGRPVSLAWRASCRTG